MCGEGQGHHAVCAGEGLSEEEGHVSPEHGGWRQPCGGRAGKEQVGRVWRQEWAWPSPGRAVWPEHRGVWPGRQVLEARVEKNCGQGSDGQLLSRTSAALGDCVGCPRCLHGPAVSCALVRGQATGQLGSHVELFRVSRRSVGGSPQPAWASGRLLAFGFLCSPGGRALSGSNSGQWVSQSPAPSPLLVTGLRASLPAVTAASSLPSRSCAST